MVASDPTTGYDETYDPEKSGMHDFTGKRPDGAHGTGYRFMPMASMANEPGPALVCIAGAYPGLTAEQLQVHHAQKLRDRP